MYLQLKTKFKPFSYDEMIKPLLYYKQAYDVASAAYADLAEKTGIFDNIVDKENSPEAYNRYTRYSNDLDRAVSSFSKGMTAQNSGELLRLKGRFARDIKPIELAYTRREALAAEQRKAELADPSMMWQRRASEMSLDDLINNPSMDYGAHYSGKDIEKEVYTAAAQIAKEARDSEEGRRKLRQILPYQYELVRQKGFTRDAVMKAMMNEPNADLILTGLVENAVNRSGVKNWGNEDNVRRAYGFARQGLFGAIGETTYDMVKDEAGLAQLQADLSYRNAVKLQDRQNALAAGVNMWHFQDSHLIGDKDGAEDQYADFKKRLWINSKGQFTKGGAKAAQKGEKIAYLVNKFKRAATVREKAHIIADLAILTEGRAFPNHKDIDRMSDNDLASYGKISGTVYTTNPYYRMYVEARKAGISRESIVAGDGHYKQQELTAFRNKANSVSSNPTIPTITHALKAEDGKELYNSIAANLAKSNVYGIRIDSKGNVVSNSKGVNLLDLNKEGKMYVTHMSIAPTSPDKAILTLSDGQRVLLDRPTMGQVFGESTTNSLVDIAKSLVTATPNERIRDIKNLNELMGTATTMWGSPEATSTGLLGASYNFKQ